MLIHLYLRLPVLLERTKETGLRLPRQSRLIPLTRRRLTGSAHIIAD
jgi:hypothetical protein